MTSMHLETRWRNHCNREVSYGHGHRTGCGPDAVGLEVLDVVQHEAVGVGVAGGSTFLATRPEDSPETSFPCAYGADTPQASFETVTHSAACK